MFLNYFKLCLKIEIILVHTSNSVHFMKNLDQEIIKTCTIYTDKDEWNVITDLDVHIF